MILWGLVALRLVLPLSVSSTLSLLRLGNAADLPAQLEDALNSDDTYRGNYKTAIEESREYELAVLAGSPVAANTEGGKMAYYYERANGSIAPAKTSYEMFLIIGSYVWLAGMAALWLWAICSYLRLKYRLRFSIRLCKGVYETDAVQYYREDDPLAYYQLQIGSASLEGFGDNVANILWGISLDGQHILLVLYEDGPSADPFTHFYHYQENNITEIGGFACDIRLCEISSDGIITGFIRKEITQTDWITVRWQISQSGLLEEIPQDIYDFRSRNWVQLYEELPLHTAVRADDTYTIQPQNIRFLQTSADWNWVLLETEDGQQGWVHLDNFEVVELQKNVMDVFDGLYMAG